MISDENVPIQPNTGTTYPLYYLSSQPRPEPSHTCGASFMFLAAFLYLTIGVLFTRKIFASKQSHEVERTLFALFWPVPIILGLVSIFISVIGTLTEKK